MPSPTSLRVGAITTSRSAIARMSRLPSSSRRRRSFAASMSRETTAGFPLLRVSPIKARTGIAPQSTTALPPRPLPVPASPALTAASMTTISSTIRARPHSGSSTGAASSKPPAPASVFSPRAALSLPVSLRSRVGNSVSSRPTRMAIPTTTAGHSTSNTAFRLASSPRPRSIIKTRAVWATSGFGISIGST